MTSHPPFDDTADGSQTSPLATALSILVSLILLLVAVPLAGALTRYRAQYSPRRVILGTDGEQSASSAKGGSSYFGMIARTYRKEGFSGLYRGLVPTVLQLVFLIIFSVIVILVTRQHSGAYPIPTETISSDFFYSLILTIVVIPLTVLTYRSMATPVPLSLSSPLQNTRTIFSSRERTRPWTLYAIPGLVAAQVLYVILCPLVLRLSRQFIVPDMPGAPGFGTSLAGEDDATGGWWGPVVYIVFVALVSLILTPLEIISVRLAVQKDMSKSGTTSEATESSPLIGDTLEPIVKLRSGREPYTGIMDCARKVIDEEGRGALYRAWWITLVVTLGVAFA